jgi:hypothetical protein
VGVGCGQHGRRCQLQNGNDNAYGKGHGGYDEDCNHTCIDGDITPRADGIAAIDAAMMNFTAMSPPCQLLLDGDKTISCPDFTTKDCYIRGLSAWDTKSSNTAPMLLIPMMNATGSANFCSKTELALLIETSFVGGKVTASLYQESSHSHEARQDVRSGCGTFGSKPHKLKGGMMGIQVDHKKMDAVGW